MNSRFRLRNLFSRGPKKLSLTVERKRTLQLRRVRIAGVCPKCGLDHENRVGFDPEKELFTKESSDE